MAGLRVLISGASIAGPVTAYWLERAGADVTIVERADELRPGGQSIDIRGHGLTIVKRMGMFEAIKAITTHEKGLRFVDANDVIQAEFPVAAGEDRFEFTADIEILRGQLAQAFYEATKDKVKYIFGKTINKIEKTGSEVTVTFSNASRNPTQHTASNDTTQVFDLIIAADGQSSTTARLALGKEHVESCIRSLNQWTTWFSLPLMNQDANWWLWHNAPGSRLLMTRPDDNSNRGALSATGPKYKTQMREMLQEDTATQKAKWRELFTGTGWRSQEILDGMDAATDFYMQEIVQVRLPTYHNYTEYNTVLVGDAAYAPSPISGMGTSLAIIGSYILAGEIATTAASSGNKDLAEACKTYEDRMRPLVDRAQKLPPGTPGIANPETWWGIRIFNFCLWVASWPVFFKVLSLLGTDGNPPASSIELSEYDFDGLRKGS